MVEAVDLLLLSVRAPLADAVAATVCHRWRAAADLWLDVYQQPAYRRLAACCGLEATLKAGLLDLADYFHSGLAETSSAPDFLTQPWRRSLAVRRERARFHAGRVDATGARRSARETTRHLVDLQFYAEAIRETFRRGLLQSDHGAAVLLLAECYFRIGDHEALVALGRSHQLHLAGGPVRAMQRDARAALAREALGPVRNAADFVHSHPAGRLLAPFLDAPQPAYAPHG